MNLTFQNNEADFGNTYLRIPEPTNLQSLLEKPMESNTQGWKIQNTLQILSNVYDNGK